MKKIRILLLSLVMFLAYTSISSGAEPLVVMETSKGNITLELEDDRAPVSCRNFRQYVKDGFFNGTLFHRVIPGFMVQAGGFEPGMQKKKTRKGIINEADNGLKNRRGSLAMARTASINSGTAQFYINVNDNRSLDHKSMTQSGYGYAVFGKVVDGMDVVDAIVNVPRGRRGRFNDVPVEDVMIVKMYER